MNVLEFSEIDPWLILDTMIQGKDNFSFIAHGFSLSAATDALPFIMQPSHRLGQLRLAEGEFLSNQQLLRP